MLPFGGNGNQVTPPFSNFSVSPDHNRLSYELNSEDCNDRQFEIFFRGKKLLKVKWKRKIGTEIVNVNGHVLNINLMAKLSGLRKFYGVMFKHSLTKKEMILASLHSSPGWKI